MECCVTKYRVLAAAMLIEILLGFQYTWAVFARVLREEYRFTSTQTQTIFGATVVFFSVGFLVGGRILDKTGPCRITIAGALFYAAGLIVAGLGGPRFSTLLVGAGVLVGLGIAFGYVGPLATPVKWFPNRKGTVTGLVVGAFASGSFFLSGAAKLLLRSGMTIFGVFIVFGLAALVGVTVLACFLSLPPGSGTAEERRSVRLPEGLVRTGHFWALVVGLFSGTFAGLSLIGALEDVGKSMHAPELWLGLCVMVLSLGNMTGRFGWGMLFERIGARKAVLASLLLQTCSIGLLAVFGHVGPAFLALSFAIGFNYGGNFVLYAAEVSHTYGAYRVGTVYGLIYFIYILSGLTAPFVAGRTFDAWATYTPALILAASMPAIGAFAFFFLYRRPWQPQS
jgi:OFA family oxalate/formate antiporter-like MFS transporter